MSDPVSSPAPLRLPLSVLTGFLGSGKTTLLSALVRRPELSNTAVVINEFGDVGLDHLLVERSSEDVVLMNSGCLCCTVRGDLVETLRSLVMRRASGDVPRFDRVIIETTGLADPAPILHTLMTDTLAAGRFRLDGVITLVDAVNGHNQLDRHMESVKQAAMADRIVLSKTDLADARVVATLESRLKELNPAAVQLKAVHGAVEPDELLDAGLYDPATKSLDVRRWLQAEAYADARQGARHGEGFDDGHGGHPHHHDVNRHDEQVGAFCLTLDEPISWQDFAMFADALTSLRGEDLLRLKGLLNVSESERPVVVHGVQHVFHPPVQLQDWPDDDRRSRIVFITRNMDRSFIERMFTEMVGGHRPSAAHQG